MAAHNELGKEGELLAANHLQSEGYVIRHRNWRCGHKELDIVAEKDGTLVFVEVKTRKDVLFGLPEDAVTNGKIRRIVSSADAYLRKYGRKRASPAKAYRGRLLPAAILTCNTIRIF